jgi:membrane-bound metal-dependent hydrolase YbcI (DUF457 family)
VPVTFPAGKKERFYLMASPVAHSFAGLWTFLLFAKQLHLPLTLQWRSRLAKLGLLIVVANLPDFDFAISFAVLGNDKLHHEFTHSLTLAVLVSLALSYIWRIARSFWPTFAIYFTAYGSHLLIDLFTGSRLGWTASGSGIPLFWPCDRKFSSPLILIPGVRHGDLHALFSLKNASSAMYEMLVFGGITAVVLLIRARRARHR